MFRKHLIKRRIILPETEIRKLNIKMKGTMESLHEIIYETQITEIQHKLSETPQNHELKQKIK